MVHFRWIVRVWSDENKFHQRLPDRWVSYLSHIKILYTVKHDIGLLFRGSVDD